MPPHPASPTGDSPMPNSGVTHAVPSALSAFAARQQSVAGDVSSTADTQRWAHAPLTPTFGLVGAGFLVTLDETLRRRSENIRRLADAHRRLDNGAVWAAADYRATDHHEARDLTAGAHAYNNADEEGLRL